MGLLEKKTKEWKISAPHYCSVDWKAILQVGAGRHRHSIYLKKLKKSIPSGSETSLSWWVGLWRRSCSHRDQTMVFLFWWLQDKGLHSWHCNDFNSTVDPSLDHISKKKCSLSASDVKDMMDLDWAGLKIKDSQERTGSDFSRRTFESALTSAQTNSIAIVLYKGFKLGAVTDAKL